MRNLIRILLLLSPIIIVGFAIYEVGLWHPPIDPEGPHYIGIDDLLDHIEVYKAPMKLVLHGEVYNKSLSGDMIYIHISGNEYFRVNCSDVDISAVEGGKTIYMRGISYYHDPSKEYFLAEDVHIHVSYSLYLSIPGAFLILLILFLGFKFQLKDFSFSRKSEEESNNA